jgi:selenide,water dikinase
VTLHQIHIGPDVSPFFSDILFDPQTSGGLLIAVPKQKAAVIIRKLKERGRDEAAVKGRTK